MEKNYLSKKKLGLNLKQLLLTIAIGFSSLIIVGQTTAIQNFDFTSLSGGTDGQDAVSQTISENIINFKARIVSNNYNYNPYILRIIAPDGTVYNLGASYDTSGTQFNSGVINEAGGSWQIDVFEPVTASGSLCRVEFEYTYVSYDLDSDNDGILNVFEGGQFCFNATSTFSINSTRLNPSGAFSPYTLNTQLQAGAPGGTGVANLTGFAYGAFNFSTALVGTATWNNGVQIQNVPIIGDHIYFQPNNTTPANYAEYTINLNTNNNGFSFVSAGLNVEDTFEIYAFNGATPIDLSLSDLSGFISTGGAVWTTTDLGNAVKVVSSSATGGTAVDDNLFTTTIPSTVTRIVIRSYKNNSTTGTVTAAITSMQYCTAGPYRDSDGDTIADYLDLDSDNDGIYDAVEAGHNQPHTNGIVNGSVGSNGIPDAVETANDSNVTNYTIRNTDSAHPTNSDLIPDYLDLDSDGDGCSDANEAYGNGTLAAFDQQYGQVGGAIAPINIATGKVTAASYAAPVNADSASGNLVPDYLQLSESVLSINTNPADQIITPTNNAVFSVTATNGLSGTAISYQWQEQVNGAGPWTNIVNGGVYSNATTASITISVTNGSLDGNLYRAIVSSPTFACDTDLTSTSALLDVRPVATNDNAGPFSPDQNAVVNVLTNDTTGDVVVPTTVSLVNPGSAINIVTDLNGDITSFEIPGEGTWNVHLTTGVITFDPVSTFNDDPTPVQYNVEDADGNQSNNATITLDYVPVATADVSNGNTTNNPVTVNVLTNDITGDIVDSTTLEIDPTNIDGDADPLTLFVATVGTWTVGPNPGEITFTPVVGFTSDPAPITYYVEDNEVNSTNALLTITYTAIPPVAGNDSLPGQTTGTAATVPVTDNDSDADGVLASNTLQITGTALAGNSLVVAGEGTWSINILTATTAEIEFTPLGTFTGDPTPITYIIRDNDGNSSNAATVAVDYTAVPPVAQNDLSSANTPNTAVTIDPTANNGNGIDLDGDAAAGGTLNLTTVSLVNPGSALNVVTDANGDITSFDIAGEGNWSVDVVSGAITFTPLPSFNDDPTPVQYNIEDNDGNQSNNATVTIDYLPVATADVSNGNTTLLPAVTNVLANDITGDVVVPATLEIDPTDIDGDGDPLTLVVADQGTWTANVGTGEITFTPCTSIGANCAAIFTGNPTPITYFVEDNDGNSVSALLTVTYTAIPPVAGNDSLPGQTTGTVATVSVTDNDSDADGVLDSSTLQITGTASAGVPLVVAGEGTWSINILTATTAEIEFTPLGTFTGDPTPITYIIRDNDGNSSNAATVTVDYTAVPPVAQNDLSSANTPNTAVTIDPTANNGNGIDLDGDAAAGGTLNLTTVSMLAPSGALNVITDANGDVTSFDIPLQGNWSVDGVTGAITFTPLPAFNDDPTPVQYNIEDNDGNQSNNATVTIDYVPVASNDVNTVVGSVGLPITIDVTTNDITGDIVDVSSVVLEAVSVGGVQVSPTEVSLAGVGVWEVDNSGNVTFTPDLGLPYTQDPPVISYTIEDSEGNISNQATIQFDYAPIAVANTSTGNPINSPVIVDVLANDITGDVVDPTTVSLVNPGSAINIVTDLNGDITSFEIPGQGTWNVNLTTGAITFAPFSGFITNPTPINYNVEDAQGNQSNNALVTIEFIPQADIEVTKTDNSATYTPGTNIVYTITVTNNGPAIATNVVVLDDITNATLEAVTTWTADNATSGTGDINENIATLNSGSSVVYTVTIAVPSSFTGTIVNTASATSDIADPDLTNNSSTDTNTENALAEIVLTKTVSVGPHNVGSNVTFTLTLTNNGPSDATGIDVLDQLPSGYTFVSATPSVGSYNSSTGLWAIASLTDTSVATLNVVATINATGNYTNVAEVTDADQPDPNGIVHGNQTPGEIDQADVTITPIPITNLYTTKTVDNATPNTGDIVKYTLTVVNNGPSVATGVSLVDNLPAGTSYVSHLATGGSVNIYSSGTWTIGTIDIGESATLTIDAVVTALGTLAQTPIVNTISSISVNETDPSPTIDDDSASITVTASNLVTVKTVDDTTPDEGQTIVYSIAVTNNGPSVATNVSLTDLLPAGVTYVSDNQSGAYNSGSGIWIIGTLGISATATLNITATVNVGTSGDVITNNTTVATGDQTDPTTVGDDLTEVITVNNDAAISLTKVVDDAMPNTGDLVTYTITVTNNGPALVTNLVVNDVLPAGLIQGLVVPTTGTWSAPNWNIGTLAVGKTETMTIEAIVTAAGTFDQIPIPNTATHTQDQNDSTPPSGNTANITVTSTDLVTIKTVDDTTPEEGQTIVYSIAVTNYGPSDATGVSLVDLLPAGVTYVSDNQGGNYNSGDGNWIIGNLASGATITLEITATVDELTSGDIILNTTTAASGDQTDPNTVGPVIGYPGGLPVDDLTETITVENLSDIRILKIVDNSNPNTGDKIVYTISVKNEGPAVVTGLYVTDILPVGVEPEIFTPSAGTWSSGNWLIGTLPVGKTEHLTIEATVYALGRLDQQPIVNYASHTQDQIDSTSPSSDFVSIIVTASDLVTVKTVSDTTPQEGDTIVYSIAVTNNGPSPATGVSLTDLLPAGVTYLSDNQTGSYNSGSGIWTIGDMAIGATSTLLINAKVNEGTGGEIIVNTTTVANGDQTDPTTVGDILAASITVQNIADIVLTKVVDNPTPNIGDTVTYTVTVTNNGTAVVKNLVVNDALPTGLTFATVSPSDGVWNAPNWTIGTLTPGEKETIVIKAIVGMDQGGKTLINAVSNTQDQTDTNVTEDDLTAIIVVTSSDLVTVKTVSDATPEEGDTIIYNIAVTNNGPSAATGVSLTDLLPDGVTYVGDNQNGAYNKGSGLWTIGAIANGATKVLSITVKVNAGTGGKTIVNNTTAAKGNQADPTTVGDDLTESIKVENIADIVLTKVVDNATPNVGDTVTYTVTVTNKGTAIVTNLVVKDALPVGLTYGTVSPSDGVWNAPNWTIGTLTPGEKETIVIKAIVGMDQGGKTLTNVVSNTQDQVDTNLTPDSNSAKIVVTNSDLSTVKTVSNKTPNEGDTITYTIVVKNNGGSNATNVSLIDNLPVGVTYVSNSATSGTYNYGSGLWTVGNLANGASATLTITATVNAGTLGKTITNTTSAVKADQSDSTPENNIGSVAIVPTAFIDLSLTKTVVDDVVNPQVDDIVTFEIRVNNAGPTNATGVQVTDLIPSGYDFINYSSSIGTYNPKTGLWSIGVIEVGNPAILLVDVKVLGTGVYSNCAEVTKANEIDVDSTPANGKATEDDYACASAAPNQSVDLAIVKTVVANNVKPMVNTQVSFEIRLTNKGNIDATEVIAKDLLPSGYRFVNYSSSRGTYDFATGIWTVGKIVNGETEILVVDAIVKESGDYLNCATITSLRQVDINAANNTSCIATTPIQVADLELTKDVDNYEPYAESNVVFTITLTNNGPSKGTGIVVKDKLPSGYKFVSATASVGTYDATSGLWNVGIVAINGTQTLEVTAYVLPIGEWENVAEVTAANELDLDSTPGNNDKYEDDQASVTTEPIILVTMPESFSPNGDGINEVFEIEHLQVLYPNFSMEIVDRYGNLVYTYKHNGNASVTPKWWDGFSNGKLNFNNEKLPAGTYFYTIYFNNNERKPQTGWIYLRR